MNDYAVLVDRWLNWASASRNTPGTLTRADIERAAFRSHIPADTLTARAVERGLTIRDAA